MKENTKVKRPKRRPVKKKKPQIPQRPVIVFDRQERPDHANEILKLIRSGKHEDPKIPKRVTAPKEVSYCRACATKDVGVFANGWWYCSPCFNERFARCSACHFPLDKTLSAHVTDHRSGETRIFCGNCVNIFTAGCCGCGNVCFTQNMVSVLNANYYCQPCADRHLRVCPRCNRHVNRDRMIWNDSEQGYTYCNQCAQTARSNSGADIIPWNAPVNLVPRGEGPPHYGIELEIECGENRNLQDVSTEIAKWTSGWSCHKGDGSLRNGFEIVSCPASVEEHRKMWTPFLDNRPSYITSWQSGTCGMHIHITRAGLSQLQIAKMLVFLNSNKNKEFIKLLCGRYNVQYAKKTGFHQGLTARTEKYSSLNTSPRNTIELRLFRGTLNKNSFFKNLEFTEALVVYTSPATTSLIKSVGPGEFIKLVEKNRKRWPHLHAYIQ